MREVSVERFVRATPAELERALTPRGIVTYEGSYSAREVEKAERGWMVRADGGGMDIELFFESTTNGFEYEQQSGPLETQVTTLRWHAENDGSRVEMSSVVSLGLPFEGVTDRVAAWKRRGELRRALSGLAHDVE